MIVLVLTLVVSLFANSCLSLKTINLNGQWSVSNSNKSITVPGVVPGSMYTALMANSTIGDPYYRKNDDVYRWIGKDDWTYSRTFTLTSDVLQYKAVVLVCDGLDTVSTVVVNNKTVGTSDNMFVRYVYDIKAALVVGENTISVGFRSAPKYVEEIAKKRQYPILPLCVPPEYHGECGANLIRKTQCSFSWDWGPSFPTQGIWKDIYIQGYDTLVMRDVTSETIKDKDGSWLLKVDVFTDVPLGTSVQGHIEVKLANTSVTQSMQVTLTSDLNMATLNISIPKAVTIREWWPNGYGEQTLYDLFVFFTDSFGTMNNKRIRIGFRTVEVVEDYVSANKSIGRSFYFRINGQAIFLKGSNWIPADAFLERITRDRVYNYLKSAADVHMNTMRVWGGGIYEFDMFYEIADELGIMIWQDFMFACAMYPTDDDFLSSVGAEVRHQLRRLKHHPSIIALSGNNENEKALRQDWYGTDINFTRYKNDYLKLYKDTVHTIVMQEDTSRPFLSSSPSNGIETQLEGWVAKQPWSTHYGDIHFYDYLVPFFDPSQYRIPRMSSEYGLQSFPSYETLEPVYKVEDMDYWSDLNDYRNHHPFGNVEMMAEAIQYLKLPNNPDRKQRFKDLIYVTQIDHAVGMKVQTEHYRRWQNQLDNEGQGNTMGALYWMLADIWQAPTWASIEYGGKWKMLHYFARQFFAPTLISPFLDGNDIDVFIVIDELFAKEVRHPVHHTLQFRPKSNPRPFSIFDISTWGSNQATNISTNRVYPQTQDQFSGNLYVEMYSWDSFQALYTWKIPFTINTTAQSVFRHNINDMISTSGCIRNRRCFLFFHLGDPLSVSAPTNFIPLSQYSNAEGLSNATIQISNVQASSTQDEFNISLTTDAIAPFVWIDAYKVKGRFSDNGFLMLRKTMTLTFYAWETIDAGNVEMMAEAIQYLKLPNNPDRKQRFKDLIYVTQIDHAVGMKVQTEHYRRWQNQLDNEGQGNTMGALYWMLADIWQAPTWASIEYGGKWKMLHYFARQFFAPTLISPFLDGNDIDVFIVIDELFAKEVRHPVHHTLQFRPKSNPRPFSIFDISTWGSNQATNISTNRVYPQTQDQFSGNLYVEMYSWDSFQALYTWKIPFTINTTAQSVFRHNINDMISTSGCIRNRRCFLFFHLGDPLSVSAPTNFIPLSQYSNAEGLSNATIQISNVQASSTQDEFNISLTTDAIAPFVWIDAYKVKGRFSDNGFLMLRKTMTLTFYAWETIDAGSLRAALSVKSLMNMYH